MRIGNIPNWMLIGAILVLLEIAEKLYNRFSIKWLGETFAILAMGIVLFILIRWGIKKSSPKK